MLLKCTIQRLLVYLLCCAAIDTIHVQNFFIIPNRSSVFIKKKKTTSYLCLPLVFGNLCHTGKLCCALCLCEFASSRDLM